MLTVGELFAGIGGIGLGLENTGGFQVKWQVERDEYASKVLAKHWPEVQRFENVREFPPTDEGNYYVDLIAGGFPCQDISVAGKGEGLKGERSGLFYEIVRIAERLKPKYLLLENVSALLIRGMDYVLGELAAIGYDAEWHCIPAAAVGAPHRRDRVFIVAYAKRHDRWHGRSTEPSKRNTRLEPRGSGERQFKRKTNTSLADSDDRHIRQEEKILSRGYPAEFGGENVADADSFRREGNAEKPLSRFPNIWRQLERSRENLRTIWAIEPNVGRVADGVPRRVDRLKCLGNAVVPQVAQFLGEMILRAEQCKDS